MRSFCLAMVCAVFGACDDGGSEAPGVRAAVQSACQRYSGCGLQPYDACTVEATPMDDAILQCIAGSSCEALSEQYVDCDTAPDPVDPDPVDPDPVDPAPSCNMTACSDGPQGDAFCRARGCGACSFGACLIF